MDDVERQWHENEERKAEMRAERHKRAEARHTRKKELNDQLDRELSARGMTRRQLVKGGMAMATAVGLGSLFAACGGDDDSAAPPPAEPAEPAPAEPAEPAPAEPAPAEPAPAEPAPAEAPAEVPPFTGTIRVHGLGVDLIDPIREAAEAALGFTLQFDVNPSSFDMVNVGITQPDTFDIFSGYHYMYDQIWPAGTMQPAEIARLEFWDEINPLWKKGKHTPGDPNCQFGDGDAPFRKIYLDPDGTGQWPTSSETPTELDGVMVTWIDESTEEEAGPEPSYVSGVPSNINMDSMGYNNDVITLEADQVSWGELFNPEWNGRVAVLNDPGIGMQDTGSAAEALGLVTFGSMGNMTREEIDALIEILLELKDQGQFRAFWTSFDESVSLMSSGEVVIESMWSPAVALLAAQAFPIRYAAPPEGFRGWSGGHAIPAHVEDPSKLQAVYDYINWWNSGEPANIMMRQGYYNGNIESLQRVADPDEFAYWIGGEPAARDLPGILGNPDDIKEGEIRDGGSFLERACNYRTWNSFFDEQEYQIQRWQEFLG